MVYESKDTLVERLYTQPERRAFDMFQYQPRKAEIKDLNTGEIIYQKEGVVFPVGYSDLAVNIVASKYFAREGVPETGEEKDMKQMVGRVATSLRNYGQSNGYFRSEEEANTFQEELSFMVLNQMYSPNSPTWFNAGKGDIYGIKGSQENGLFYFNETTGQVEKTTEEYSHPQCSACFILGLEDKLFGENSITDWWNTETRLFKFGSGSGVNLERLRSILEKLSGGGYSSGAQSFALVSDQIANVVKSGGITRRAAKMVIQHYTHPEVLDFIQWKVESEKQVRALVASGLYSPQDAYKYVSGQNSNNSVRVDDNFMYAVMNKGNIELTERKSGQVRHTIPAEQFMIMVAAATHISGDPGLQYDTIINMFNPVKNSGRINSSNPCSEYMFLDDSACNLGSLNLKKFVRNGRFDIESFEHAARIATIAQEIIVDYAGYPGSRIAENSHRFRPLGVGYANLGALLMSAGLDYNSDYSREIAAAITSIMAGTVYEQSARLAKRKGPFKEFEKNKEPFLEVMNLHRTAASKLKSRPNGGMNLEELVTEGKKIWNEVVESGTEYGFRNAQGTLLAPTGTIGFLMDCDTTGIEPDLILVKYKNLVGGGIEKIVNQSVGEALTKLGYSPDQIKDIKNYILSNNHVENAPHLKKEHYPVFDTANKPNNGTRFLEPMAHIKMMAATQPFLSGAISKTVNVPASASIEEIFNLYVEGWKQGLKALAIYRDGSKLYQPLFDESKKEEEKLLRGQKIPLDERREALTRVTTINTGTGLEYRVHLITGEYPDGDLGEIRVQISKQGSQLRTNYDNFGIALSEGLKTGVPLVAFAKKYINTKTDISGATTDSLIRSCTSLEDWMFKSLVLEYLGVEKYKELTGDYNFRLSAQKERELRLNRVKEERRSQIYFDSIAEINRKMGLETIEDMREFDKELRQPEDPNANMPKRIHRLTTTGDTCDCGGQLILNGKCKKCINCGRTVGGCAV
ncbi:vitamin B12-dependent ribonucleotide reductase [Candidatus Woesearchaeota archaeon]|nr:vitamin B12-dependent ribonucleotide reductase [Candidatus Woesearchaeota archaeon]